jgi:hypothetical protein
MAAVNKLATKKKGASEAPVFSTAWGVTLVSTVGTQDSHVNSYLKSLRIYYSSVQMHPARDGDKAILFNRYIKCKMLCKYPIGISTGPIWILFYSSFLSS